MRKGDEEQGLFKRETHVVSCSMIKNFRMTILHRSYFPGKSANNLGCIGGKGVAVPETDN